MLAGEKCFWLTRLIKRSVQSKFDPATRYVGAITISVMGLLCAIYLKTLTGMFGVPVTILTTVIAAMFGGLGPGILAALISAAGVDIYLVNHSLSSGSFSLSGLVRLLVLVTISCLVGFLVSFLRMALESAEHAREEAEKANCEKDAVIAFLSHDLRGPLSSISLTFQLIQRMANMANKHEEIHRLSANGVFFCQRMTQLIQNLLDASKIKSGGLRLLPGLHDLRALVTKIYEEHRLLAEEKKIEFRLNLAGDSTYDLCCDQVLLSQVLANLILNSFKFTPAGGRVELKLRGDEQALYLEVSDNGQGIPREQLEMIFEKFWHAKTRIGEGTGLGLFVSRAIVEAHQGTIAVESAIDQGSRFLIQLPRSKAGSDPGSQSDQVSLSRVLRSA